MYILSIKYNMTNNTDDSLFQKSLKRALGGGVSIIIKCDNNFY